MSGTPQNVEKVGVCPDCGHADRLHYALGHVGCHNLSCPCERVVHAAESAEIDGVRLGTLWKRNGGREVVRVERAWLYGHPVAEPTVRAHPTHGGRPIVAPTAWLREHYAEVVTSPAEEADRG